MGILGLARLIADVCPKGTVKEVEMKSYFGRRIAIDASMSLYQFMIAIRHSQDYMTNESGETTSHIVGFFYRTCKMLEMGIKPVYVFDGKPPVLKGGTLDKRKEAREEAMKKLDEAREAGSKQDVEKYTKRLTRVTKKHNEDVKKLLSLMGLPVIESPSEAEAQCAQLCKEGLVYAVATEDMDALTFGTPKLVRKFTSGTGDKIQEYDLAGVLKGLSLSHDQFIDLCILMGCDYCGSIKGIGPKKGLDLIQKYSSIENILKEKYEITEFVDNVEIVYSDRRERTEEVEKSEDTKGNGTAEKTKANGSSFQDVKDKIKETVDKEVKALNGEEVKTEGDEEKLFPGMEDEKDISDDELNRPEQVENSGDNEDDSFEKKPEDDEEDEEKTEPEDGEDEEDSKPSKKKKASKKAKAPKRDVKVDVPENWLFKGARKLFTDAQVSIGKYTEGDLKMKDPDEEGLINFLVKEHSFSEDRVRGALKRIKDSKPKASQTRIDSFFKVLPKDTTTPPKKTASSSTASKRKNEPAKGLASAGKKGRKPK